MRHLKSKAVGRVSYLEAEKPRLEAESFVILLVLSAVIPYTERFRRAAGLITKLVGVSVLRRRCLYAATFDDDCCG